jgi:hypothetical protein
MLAPQQRDSKFWELYIKNTDETVENFQYFFINCQFIYH